MFYQTYYYYIKFLFIKLMFSHGFVIFGVGLESH